MRNVFNFAYGLALAIFGFLASVRHERQLNRSLALGDEEDNVGEILPSNVPDGRIHSARVEPRRSLRGGHQTGPIQTHPPVFPGEERFRAPKHPNA
jgi:hypothetical protein